MIQGWSVNRELNELVLMLAPAFNSTAANANTENAKETTKVEKASMYRTPSLASSGRVVIRPVGVPVQKVSEALGANVFLSLRSPTKSQELDEGMFYRLIGASPTKSLYPSAPNASAAAAPR